MARTIWVNTYACYDLLPGDTKPLSEPMLTYDQWIPVVTWGHLVFISVGIHIDVNKTQLQNCIKSYNIDSKQYSFE